MLVRYLLLSLFTAAFASAAAVDKTKHKVIKLDFGHSGTIGKRDGNTAVETLPFSAYPYAELEVGSNREKVKLIVDTGSWLTTIFDTSINCVNNKCDRNYLYNSSSSTSAVRRHRYLTEKFGEGYYYRGENIFEDVYFDGLKVSNYSIMDVTESEGFQYGILGLSHPPSDDLQENIAWAAKYSGAIDKAAYSLNLYNRDDSPGSLVIGGYDAAKLDSEIHWSSIKGANVQANLNYVEFDGVKIPVNKNYTLDTGGINGFLPRDAFNKFIGSLPKDDYNNPVQTLTIDCAVAAKHNFTYNLNGVDYTFPLTAMLEPNALGHRCDITLRPGDAAQLGPKIFRWLFLAVDLEKDMLGLATIKNTTESDIRAF
ncbi:Candidapepsin [Candida viswanathii]|uniref:Candidapepsin n=1 Tax=Candida viswanathii TaxID=5486 RepID=A0A367XYV7_9ASCO|nr:Candidapepsin [Candida viswanathii]